MNSSSPPLSLPLLLQPRELDSVDEGEGREGGKRRLSAFLGNGWVLPRRKGGEERERAQVKVPQIRNVLEAATGLLDAPKGTSRQDEE